MDSTSTATGPGGRVIDNPISGERIVIRLSGEETDGALLRFDLHLPAGGHVPSGHVHPGQSERFLIRAGRMRFRIRRQVIHAGPGDVVSVPAGVPHWFGNDGPEAALAEVEVRPALRMEELFRRSGRLGRRVPLLGLHLPRPTDLAVFLTEFEREVAVPYLPRRLVRAALTPMLWAARRRRPR